MSSKNFRSWLAILYTENFVFDWEIKLKEGLSSFDYCYIIHDKDKFDNGDLKKSHLHLWLSFPTGGRSQSFVIKLLVSLLERDPDHSIFSVQKLPIPDTFGIIYAHDYFLHLLPSCANKFHYSNQNLICSFRFNDLYNKSLANIKNDDILDDIIDIIEKKGFINYSDLFYYLRQNHDKTYSIICRKHYSFLTQLTKGNYLRKISCSRILKQITPDSFNDYENNKYNI